MQEEAVLVETINNKKKIVWAKRQGIWVRNFKYSRDPEELSIEINSSQTDHY